MLKALSPAKLSNTYGVGNLTLTGSFLITFRNCSVSIDGETVDIEIQGKERLELLPVYNVKARQRNSELLLNLHELHDLHIENRKHLESLTLTTEKDKWLTFGVLLAIIATLAGVTIFLIRKRILNSVIEHVSSTIRRAQSPP